MRGGVRQIEEERLARRDAALDEVERLAGQNASLEVGRRRAVMDDRPVLVQVVVVGVLGVRQRPVPLVPARRHETAVLLAVAVQELAHERRPVAGLLKPQGKRVRGVEQAEAVAIVDPVVVCILAGLEGSPGGTAEREVDEVVGEGRALVADQRSDLRHRFHRLHGLIVGHDDDHVRPSASSLRRGVSGESHRADGEHREGERGCGSRAKDRAGWYAGPTRAT